MGAKTGSSVLITHFELNHLISISLLNPSSSILISLSALQLETFNFKVFHVDGFPINFSKLVNRFCHRNAPLFFRGIFSSFSSMTWLCEALKGDACFRLAQVCIVSGAKKLKQNISFSIQSSRLRFRMWNANGTREECSLKTYCWGGSSLFW